MASFLQEIRVHFPNIYISNLVQGEAKMFLERWGDNMAQHEPKTPGSMMLNKIVVDSMVFVGQKLLTYKSKPDPGYETASGIGRGISSFSASRRPWNCPLL